MHIVKSVFCFFILLLVASCSKGDSNQYGDGNEIPKIRCLVLEKKMQKTYLEALGSLTYFEKADVGSRVDGRIDSLLVKEGHFVYRGQSLATIEKLAFQLAYQNSLTELAQAKNRKEIAKLNYEDSVRGVLKQLASIKKSWVEVLEKQLFLKNAATKLSNSGLLLKAGGITKSAYDQAVTSYSSAQIAVTVAKKNLQVAQIGFRDQDLKRLGYKAPFSPKRREALLIKVNTSKERAALTAADNEILKAKNNLRQSKMLLKETIIRSPLTGVIAMKNIERGEQVKKDAKLFTIMDVSRLYANLSVNEDDINRIRRTGAVSVTVDALGKKYLRGKITLIHPLVDPRTRSVTVRVLVRNARRKLKPGMFARARLSLTANAKAWLVPVASVLKRKKNKGYVFVIVKSRVYKRPVITGKISGDRIEIVSGLKDGFVIAAPPKTEHESELSILKDGMQVIVSRPDKNKGDSTTEIKKVGGKKR